MTPPPGCMSRRTIPRDWLQHHPRSKTLRPRLQQVGVFRARVRKTRHNNWRIPPQRFAGFRHTPVAPRSSSPESDTTQTAAHHTDSGAVALLGGGAYAYRALDRNTRREEKTAALSPKSTPRPGLTQPGLDFLALDTLGRRHLLTLNAGIGFPPLVHPASSRFAGPEM